jgi:DNA-binding MarR family transcriptional regulator
MNAIFFGTKRVFHSVLRTMRRPLQSFGLTSARYDLMFMVFEHAGVRDEHREMLQSDMWRELGVSASVVSRMLRSLETLGLVRRHLDEVDGRAKRVMLTKRGLDAVRSARQSLRRAAQRLVDMAIGGDGAHRDRERAFWNMLHLDNFLFSQRQFLGDPSEQLYFWGHPDD